MYKKIQWAQRARLGACTILLAMFSDAAIGAEKEHRQHDVHEHGHGVLQVAVDGQELVMELRVPAVNVVGFESKPGNAEQRKLVAEAIERFSEADALFVPSKDADCSAEDSRVSLAGMSGGEDYGHGDKHKHAKEHGHDAHDGHSELAAEYHFHCETPQRLVAIKVEVFKFLRDAESIDAQVVTSSHQHAIKLTPKQSTVKLAP